MIIYFIRKYFSRFYLPITGRIHKLMDDYRWAKEVDQGIATATKYKEKRIFYLGILPPAVSNIGDIGQYYCIKKWLEYNYPQIPIFEFEPDAVIIPKFNFISKFRSIYRKTDIIVFQSGYGTQDLGGSHDALHRIIIDNFPTAKILMMPQTIFFKKRENKLRTAISYNKAINMLFLARDRVSLSMAKEMFPDVKSTAFPDIVTTLIGNNNITNILHTRQGVCLCRRNDGEKFYTEDQLQVLIRSIEENGDKMDIFDTKISTPFRKAKYDLKKYIDDEIKKFSHYKLTITDRFHGTVFSLAAGTPVIILRTTDHKVTVGAEWFSGVYDDYVYVAESLEDAYNKYKELISKNLSYSLPSYFKENYYDKLKSLFEQSSNIYK